MTTERINWPELSTFAGPQDSPGFLLWRDFMRWQRGLNALLKPFDLTQPQFAILAVCGWVTREGDVLTQQALVDFLDLDRMHISQIAGRLEKDGLIRRKSATTDRRAKMINLTSAGRRKLTEALPTVENYDDAFFRAYDRP